MQTFLYLLPSFCRASKSLIYTAILSFGYKYPNALNHSFSLSTHKYICFTSSCINCVSMVSLALPVLQAVHGELECEDQAPAAPYLSAVPIQLPTFIMSAILRMYVTFFFQFKNN